MAEDVLILFPLSWENGQLMCDLEMKVKLLQSS